MTKKQITVQLDEALLEEVATYIEALPVNVSRSAAIEALVRLGILASNPQLRLGLSSSQPVRSQKTRNWLS